MFADLFNIVAPVFICAAIGFGWARTGQPFDRDFVTNIATNIGTPCLILATLTRLEVSPETFGQMALAAAMALVIVGTVGAVVLRLAGLAQHSYLPALMFANTGNMGLPLCLFAFGQKGLALAIAVFTVNATAQFTFGVLIASGHWSAGRLVRTPILYAVAAALVFMLTGIKPPPWFANTIGLIGGLTIPLMLLALGAALARLEITSLGRGLALSLLRLGGGFLVGFGIAEALGLEGAARGVLMIQSAMPVAVFNYLFAQRYEREPEEVAGMVLISTVISFATLPALLWWVL